MSEFMEQRENIIMREERRLVLARRQEVAYQVGNRLRQAGGEPLASDALVHPCAAALVRSGVGVEIKVADGLPVSALDFEEPHVGMPHRHALAFANAHSEETLRDLEQAG